jgi:hypothetical protein
MDGMRRIWTGLCAALAVVAACAPKEGAEGAADARTRAVAWFQSENAYGFDRARGFMTAGIWAETDPAVVRRAPEVVSLYVFDPNGYLIGGPSGDTPGVQCPNCGFVQPVAIVPPAEGTGAEVRTHRHAHDEPPFGGRRDTTVRTPPAQVYCWDCDEHLGNWETLRGRPDKLPMLVFISGEGDTAQEVGPEQTPPGPPFRLRARYLRVVYVRDPRRGGGAQTAAADAAAAGGPTGGAPAAGFFGYREREVWVGQVDFEYAIRDQLRVVGAPVERRVAPVLRPPRAP